MALSKREKASIVVLISVGLLIAGIAGIYRLSGAMQRRAMNKAVPMGTAMVLDADQDKRDDVNGEPYQVGLPWEEGALSVAIRRARLYDSYDAARSALGNPAWMPAEKSRLNDAALVCDIHIENVDAEGSPNRAGIPVFNIYFFVVRPCGGEIIAFDGTYVDENFDERETLDFYLPQGASKTYTVVFDIGFSAGQIDAGQLYLLAGTAVGQGEKYRFDLDVEDCRGDRA